MRARRTRFEASMDKRNAVRSAEARGHIADSQEVRLGIVRRVESGEITPAQGLEELKRVKRLAKKNGLLTREQAFRQG